MSVPELPDAADLSLTKLGVESAISVDWSEIYDADSDYVALPSVPLDVLEGAGYSPSALRDQGHDVPEDPTEALAFARGEFVYDSPDAYYEWKDARHPVMNSLWPLDNDRLDLQACADRIAEHAPNCCLISFSDDGMSHTGIGMTAGGMDLSADLAAAYICCGYVPPMTIMESAIRDADVKLPEMLAACLDRAAEYFERQVTVAANGADRLRAVHGLSTATPAP